MTNLAGIAGIVDIVDIVDIIIIIIVITNVSLKETVDPRTESAHGEPLSSVPGGFLLRAQ